MLHEHALAGIYACTRNTRKEHSVKTIKQSPRVILPSPTAIYFFIRPLSQDRQREISYFSKAPSGVLLSVTSSARCVRLLSGNSIRPE